VVIVNPREAGFTYVAVLFAVAFMGLGLALTGGVWHTALAREREVQLLYAGNQYRRAIERYYLGGPRQFPRALEDLLKDPRKPGTERYLRKLYFDPVTGKSEWGLVKAPDGGIMGVYSLSEDSPKKVANFGFANREFEGAAKYSDWKFLYNPAAQQVPIAQQLPVPGPGTQPAPVPQQLPVPDPGNPGAQQAPVPQSAR
jgi:type II secretory pathway pseudopilin PulG